MTIVQCTCAGTCVSTVPTGTSICIHNALVQVPLLCTCAGTWLYTVHKIMAYYAMQAGTCVSNVFANVLVHVQCTCPR